MRAAVFEDDREDRRDHTCVGTGIVLGAIVGTIAGALAGAGSSLTIFVLISAAAGGITGKLIAPYISAEEWDPPVDRRANVGTNSPDEDAAPN